ncbi:hypothetical protein PRIPAC_78850 [Pristionchus pacificus]|uniref:Acyltransferase n=1 Tax=Pristionchus pacificus TaxID=54126 RepID=A0A2A6CKK8_PRIPA|nr:hypothetical protein PRIPAC_78850 [Pristionchus pacificus]|eukprot:PDM78754.1 Acyltransferase [Pristionchus pacificus]
MLYPLVISFVCLFVITGAFDAIVAVQKTMVKQQMMSKIVKAESDLFTLISESNSKLFSINKQISEIVTSNTSLAALSAGCREDFEIILNPQKHPGFAQSALIQMMDSTGKIGPAILQGHVYFAGHYSECKEIDYVVEGRERHFRADYFRTDIDAMLRPNSRNDSCKPVYPFVSLVDGFWHLGVCLPASCSSEELQRLLRPSLNATERAVTNTTMDSNAVVPNPVCNFTKPGDLTPEITSGYYITISIMGIIVGTCVLSGIVDFSFTDRLKETQLSQSMGWQLFMACSLYSNVASIFDVSETGKVRDQIGPIHCIRFFSMVWVLLAHLFGSYAAVVANPTDILYLIPDLTSEVLLNGFFSVDSFFFMSGVLLTFLWFKGHKRQREEIMSARGWTIFYVHRFLRLSPAFYVLVIFYTFVFKQMIRESPISMNELVTQDKCSESWWVELFYMHNWVDFREMCLGYSWYLDADMQMFLFTPLLIIPLAFKPLWGLIVAAVIFTISTAVNIGLVVRYHWPAAPSIIFPRDPEMSNYENYNQVMYANPLIRCQIYIMGMLVGWLLQTRKQLRIHPIVYLLAWAVSACLMLTALFGLHDQTKGTAISLYGRAMYSALSRPAWGIGLSTIVILCHYGYGGECALSRPINAFMSWHIWVPLGRLSYCGYLIHIPVSFFLNIFSNYLTIFYVIHYALSMTNDEVYFSSFIEFFLFRVVAITAATYFLAVFWSACFELSFGRIEKLLICGVRAEKADDEVVLIPNEEDVVDVEERSDPDNSLLRVPESQA